MLTFFSLLVMAYLFGSISSAVIVCKLMQLPDPRTQGSGNPGTTNVLRLGGKKLALLVLMGDVLKGVIPVIVAQRLHLEPVLVAYIGLAAFLGHLFPVFFGFQGGKGVATGIGIIIALSWPLGLAVISVFAVIVMLFRYVSLGSIIAAIITPFVALWLTDKTYFLPLLLMSICLVIRHLDNIQKLWRGTESKIKLG